jgi:transposase-like protein
MNTHLKAGANPEDFNLECASCNSENIYQIKSRIAGIENDQMSMQFLCRDCTKTSVLTISQLAGRTVIQYWVQPFHQDGSGNWYQK